MSCLGELWKYRGGWMKLEVTSEETLTHQHDVEEQNGFGTVSRVNEVN
jgi:hypothetical protein